MSEAPASQSKRVVITIWILRVLMAALFLVAGVMKLIGTQMEIDAFEIIGLGQWFRYFTGIVEVVGGVAVLIPSVSALGALLLLVVDVGAFIAQVTKIHQDWIHPIVIGAALVALVYMQRRQISARMR